MSASASCYVGCSPPPVKPPTVPPVHHLFPSSPLAFTGTGVGVWELAAAGTALVLVGLVILLVVAVRNRRNANRTSVRTVDLGIKDTPQARADWARSTRNRWSDGWDGHPVVPRFNMPPSPTEVQGVQRGVLPSQQSVKPVPADLPPASMRHPSNG